MYHFLATISEPASAPCAAGDMRKSCPFSRQEHMSLHWFSPLTCHRVRRHKSRIRTRPALLAAHQDFSLGLGPGSSVFPMIHKGHESDLRVVDPVARAQAHGTCTHRAHAGDVRLPAEQLHTSSGSSASPVWALAQDELICMCQVPQTYLVCCLVLLSFPHFFLLLIA